MKYQNTEIELVKSHLIQNIPYTEFLTTDKQVKKIFRVLNQTAWIRNDTNILYFNILFVIIIIEKYLKYFFFSSIHF